MKKVAKIHPISYRLIKIPLIFFFFLIFGFISISYIHQDYFFFTSYHKDKLFETVREKRIVIDRWFFDVKKEFSKTSLLLSESYTLNKQEEQIKTKKGQQKVVVKENNYYGDLIKNRLKEKKETGLFKVISYISNDGKVIESTSSDISGSDISQTGLFKDVISKIKDTSFIVLSHDSSKNYDVDIISPVKDDKGNIIALLHGIINLLSLQTIITQGSHISYEIVDKDGYILVASNQNNIGMKYPNQFINNMDRISFFDDKFITLVRLKELNLYLIQKVDAYYVLYPLIEVMAIILTLSLFVVFLFIYQSVYIKRQISLPINRVIGFIRSSAAGIQSVKIQGNYPKEIEELLNSINYKTDKMISANQQKKIEVKKQEAEKKFDTKNTSETNSNQLIGLITSFQSFAQIIRDENIQLLKKALHLINDDELFVALQKNILKLFAIMDNLNFIFNSSKTKTNFIFSELFDKLQKTAREINTSPLVELIIENNKSLKDRVIHGYKDAIMQVLINALYSAFITTQSGTITILTSVNENEDAGQSLIINISDTGHGYETSDVDSIKSSNDIDSFILKSALIIAEEADVEVLIESIKGKGAVVNIVINL
ncbi:MAG TPA: sensor histidine kinase [Nitrospirae bacterium]|nr:sensor histidine kinase [Nitrospirota bacterium]